MFVLASPPAEPPVLELRSTNGTVNEAIELTIAARNVSGTLDQLSITISGFPNDTKLSRGTVQADGSVFLASTEFGNINMSTSVAGIHTVIVTVTQDFGNNAVITRTGKLIVTVKPKPPSIHVDMFGCYSGSNNFVLYSWSLSVEKVPGVSGNESNTNAAVQDVYMLLPSWVHMTDTKSADDMYKLNTSMTQGTLELTKTFEPFNLTILIQVDEAVYDKATIQYLFVINQICDEGKHTWVFAYL